MVINLHLPAEFSFRSDLAKAIPTLWESTVKRNVGSSQALGTHKAPQKTRSQKQVICVDAL